MCAKYYLFQAYTNPFKLDHNFMIDWGVYKKAFQPDYKSIIQVNINIATETPVIIPHSKAL